MNHKWQSRIPLLLAISFVLLTSLTVLSGSAMAQGPSDAPVNIFFHGCLKRKFPNIERSFSDPLRARDLDSERNFAWEPDKQAWIDIRSLQAVCPAESKDDPKDQPANIYFHGCLKRNFPNVERSFSDPLSARDPDSGRNFAWEEDKQSWIDIKTLECICPKCPPGTATAPASQPPPAPKPPPDDDYRRACDLFLGYSHNRVDAGEYIGFNGLEVAVGCPVQRYINLTGSYSFHRRSEESAGTQTSANIHDFMGGVFFRDTTRANFKGRILPFARVQAGITLHRFSSHSGTFSSSGSETGFAAALGGGFDVGINNRVSWRAIQFDYNPNRVNDTWQHNFRLSTGLVLRLGDK
jgi:hypothetical protein